jgi:hypothetical protein
MQQSAERNVASPRIEMSPHSDTLSWFRANQPLLFLLNAVWRSNTYQFYRAILAVIVWLLDLQLSMQSVSIITDVVSSNLDQGDVYNIMW